MLCIQYSHTLSHINPILPLKNRSGRFQSEKKKYFIHPYYQNKRYFIHTSSKIKYNNTLSTFLTEVKNIINQYKNDPFTAQLTIEKNWLDIASKSIDFKSILYKSQNKILEEAFELLTLYRDKGNLRRTLKSLNDYIVNFDHIIIAFSHLITNFNKRSYNDLAYNIGYNVIFHIFKNHFMNQEDKKDFTQFLNDNGFDVVFIFKVGDILIETFSTFINPIFERVLDEDENYTRLKINDSYKDSVINNLIIPPQSLPMIAEPLKWGKGEFGGFLLNNEHKNSLITGSSHHSHKCNITDNIFNAVNKLNAQKFIVNKDLLDYIQKDGSFILDFYRKSNYDRYMNNIITLEIAKTYENTPFYLNVNIDWRGRIYTHSFYLDYQGSEFSLAFINLFEGEKLNESGLFYFYVYGANLYNEGKTLSKKSLQERYDWVVNNLENIYAMKPNFILKAESPTIFTSFCLTMKRLRDDPNHLVHTPVFLDATCSGVQHFAAMLLDLELAKLVNLINTTDNVNDIYSELIPHINNAINQFGVDNFKYSKFRDVSLNRSILKKVIMTKSYNVTTFGISEQLKSELVKVEKSITTKSGKNVKVFDYEVPTNSGGTVKLDVYEIDKMAEVINNNIFIHFPKLHEIYTYLTRLAKIYIKLDIPISWSTPNGLELTQWYNLSEVQKTTINLLGRNKKAVLRVWTDKKDTRKEVQAIIPNIIHSLDASHINGIINEWSGYILPIHDCFGTHPNNMEKLGNVVRVCFVNLYSDKNFLIKIDNKLKENLRDYKVETVKDEDGEEYVRIKYKKRWLKLPLPILPELGELNINEIIEKGKYMIT
jgi:hypothetical protein